jgi:hypothetical protein
VKRFEAEDLAKGKAPDHENQITALEMTYLALQRVEKYSEAFERLFEDTCMLLKVVRTIHFFEHTPVQSFTGKGSHGTASLTNTCLRPPLNPKTPTRHNNGYAKPRCSPHNHRLPHLHPLEHSLHLLEHEPNRHPRLRMDPARFLARLRQHRLRDIYFLRRFRPPKISMTEPMIAGKETAKQDGETGFYGSSE